MIKLIDIIKESNTGEGSRGGKVIGHTKSGKAIYDQPDHPAHKDFDYKDHGDAAQLLAPRKPGGNSPAKKAAQKYHWDMAKSKYHNTNL